ncbi:hypothetical protein M378DRAFT_14392 [Amanita muscaria Koide BX008]|uniref:Uncharacterized protein n=1 Tax=Amanita muscaria (strain Koide BX008) TaxID=946122 RepID=A0A0C2WFD5_AMAMK|nr:hypothetical protein M378DRAFT_14392 [Amanita muscaria Koide BX008]
MIGSKKLINYRDEGAIADRYMKKDAETGVELGVAVVQRTGTQTAWQGFHRPIRFWLLSYYTSNQIHT